MHKLRLMQYGELSGPIEAQKDRVIQHIYKTTEEAQKHVKQFAEVFANDRFIGIRMNKESMFKNELRIMHENAFEPESMKFIFDAFKP